jgi:hypothetical protein
VEGGIIPFDAKRAVSSWYDGCTDWLRESRAWRSYYDGNQWSPEELAIFRERKQPPIVYNRVARKIDAMVGHEQRLRTDPVALPRTPAHDQQAQACTDGLRFVLDQTRFDAIKSQVFEDGLIEGIGACEVCVHAEDVTITHVDPWSLIWDPRAIKHDFSDASWMGFAKWLDLSVVLELYPDHAPVVIAAMKAGSSNSNIAKAVDALTDRPDQLWVDRDRQRVQVAEIYAKQGLQWVRVIAVAGEVIVTEPSYYVDEKGKSVCPVHAWSPFVERNDTRVLRYGMVRSLMGPQTEINMRRSRMLHMLHQRRVMVMRGAVESVDQLRAELARPDGVIELAIPDGMTPLPSTEEIQGNAALLAEAKAEIDQSGPNAAIQGKGPGSASGRAIIAQQQAGMAEMQPLYDRLREWELSVYRAVWNRIRQAWTGPKWVRITDDEQVPRFMGFNVPVSAEQEVAQLAQMSGQDPGMLAQQVGLMPGDPRGQMPVRVENPVAEMDVDIVLATKPDMAVLEGEQFELLVQVLPMLAQMPPAMAKLLIKASSLRNKDELVRMLDEQSQGPNPAQQAMMQLDIADREARIRKTLAEAARAEAQAQPRFMTPPV